MKIGPQELDRIPLAQRPSPQTAPNLSGGPTRPQEYASLSAEAQEGEAETVPHLGALRESLGGQRQLVNPSAEMQQDCVNILTMLGKDIPQGVDTNKTLTASPVAKGSEVLKVDRITSVAKSDRGQELVAQLMSSSAKARAEYGGKLPPKVEQLLQFTLTALRESGIQAGDPAAGDGNTDPKTGNPAAKAA